MYLFTPNCISLLFFYLSDLSFASPAEKSDHGHEEPLVRLLYEYPKGTWIENIAVRPSGELLVTHLDKPRVDQFNPFEVNAKPKTVHTFTGHLATMGIAEIATDSFALIVGNLSLTGGATPGSWSIWNIEFDQTYGISAQINELAALPEATFPNGLCNIPSSNTPLNLLYGDIRKGVVNFVATTTGESNVAINDSFTNTALDPIFGRTGVNGIHIVDSTLYFTNSAKSIFASIPIHTNGTPAGAPHIIQHVRKPETVWSFDDFAIKGDDAYLVTGAGNSIERIGLDGIPKGRIIAGNLNSTQFAEPTSAAFGRMERDADILYVVTGGGLAAPVDGNITVGAQILAVDTSRWIS
jgi:hypothetical protein